MFHYELTSNRQQENSPKKCMCRKWNQTNQVREFEREFQQLVLILKIAEKLQKNRKHFSHFILNKLLELTAIFLIHPQVIFKLSNLIQPDPI